MCVSHSFYDYVVPSSALYCEALPVTQRRRIPSLFAQHCRAGKLLGSPERSRAGSAVAAADWNRRAHASVEQADADRIRMNVTDRSGRANAGTEQAATDQIDVPAVACPSYMFHCRLRSCPFVRSSMWPAQRRRLVFCSACSRCCFGSDSVVPYHGWLCGCCVRARVVYRVSQADLVGCPMVVAAVDVVLNVG